MNKKILYPIALVLLLVSVLANVYFYKQLIDNDKEVFSLKQDKQTILQQYQLLQRDLTRTSDNLAAISHPHNQTTLLLPTPNVPKDALVTIYWNTQNKTTYVNANLLPTPSSDRQYQVWEVLEDKTYHNLGVFNHQPDKDNIFKIKRAKEGKKFLITLELIQGQQQPSLKSIQVKN